MSPADLAREAHLDQGLISRLRRDITRPTPETLDAIAKATNIPHEIIFRKAGLLPNGGAGDDDWALAVAARIQKLPAESRNFIEAMIEHLYELERSGDKGKK